MRHLTAPGHFVKWLDNDRVQMTANQHGYRLCSRWSHVCSIVTALTHADTSRNHLGLSIIRFATTSIIYLLLVYYTNLGTRERTS